MPARISDKRRAAIMDKVSERLINGESLRKICLDPDMPGRFAILKWVNDDSELASQYAHARDIQADALDDDITATIAEIRDGTLDAQAARVIIQAVQWRAAHMRPRRYGDKLDLKMTGSLTIGIKRNERVDD